MNPRTRRLIVVASAAACLLTACGGSGTEAPTTSTTTPPSPTEKTVSPTGGNLFTPPVKAPPAPNVPPGQHPGINGVP